MWHENSLILKTKYPKCYWATSTLLTINFLDQLVNNVITCLSRCFGASECVWVMREPVNWNKSLFQSLKPLGHCGYKIGENPVFIINNSIYCNIPNKMKVNVVLLLTILVVFIVSGSAIRYPRERVPSDGSGGSSYCESNFCRCYPEHPSCSMIGPYAWAMPPATRSHFH